MNKSNRYFITATDTNAGKTYIICNLLKLLREKGFSTVALKPIAAGCELKDEQWHNQDALMLRRCSIVSLPYNYINPFALKMPIAPHIAAAKQNILLNSQTIAEYCQPALSIPADIYLIEGAGGWYVPLNDKETMADLVAILNCKVILVVGMRLGCLNHALMTYHMINNSQYQLAGWIANCLDPTMQCIEDNIKTLADRIHAPLLGVVPFNSDIKEIINIDLLM